MSDTVQFSEEYSKLLLDKEWLVKIDPTKSIPYLIKFYHSTVDLSCCVLLTDTKSVWAEVLSGQQFARRWRACNARSTVPFDDVDEDKWRAKRLGFLSRVHTLSGIVELSFEIVDTNYADIAFELEYDTFKWRWEVNYLGHFFSAEIISKHLIFPLIAMTHMTFSSTEAVPDIPDADLEKAVDKTGQAARRALDTHTKNALSKPRVAKTLSRMAAMFNFIPELPAITSDMGDIDLRTLLESLHDHHLHEPSPPITRLIKSRAQSSSPTGYNDIHTLSEKHPLADDSATESDAGTDAGVGESHVTKPFLDIPSAHRSSLCSDSPSSQISISDIPSKAASESESSPGRSQNKAKKPRLSSSSDDDSEEERRKHISQLKGRSSTTAKRGTRQPIKRGGKRF